MNEVKPSSMSMHERPQMMRNGIDGDVRIKEEVRKEEDYYRSDLRYAAQTASLMNQQQHAMLTPKHPSHLMQPGPPHLNRSMIPPPQGPGMGGPPGMSHFPPHPPPPSVWAGMDPYRDAAFRMESMNALRYNPIMEAIRAEEERAKAYAAHSSMHFRQKDQPPFTVLHHRIPQAAMKPPPGPMMPGVGLDGHKKEDSLPPNNR